jgi:hypothetical protein
LREAVCQFISRTCISRLQVMNQDALRPQRAVVQALGVGVLQRLGDVAHQLQALGDGEALAAVTQQVVQAHGLGVVIEDQRRARVRFPCSP